ncbi:MAG: tetratricopeptide repeat protein [Acidimicrobiales bacterium]
MIDVTDATFETAVLQRSTEVPVVVDLWAPWCGPCRTLGPMIERVVAATGGAVELAKVNVDENQAVSAAFKVQSIPAVYAVADRQVVDGFVGAIPEAKIAEFVGRLAKRQQSEADKLVDIGDEASLRKALELEPRHEAASVALAELLVASGDGAAEALGLLENLSPTPEVRRVRALARLGGSPSSNGTSVEARLDALLERVKADEEAKREYIDLLDALGPDDPRTGSYRRALTSRLF